MLEGNDTSTLLGPLADQLSCTLALLSPGSFELIECNAHFKKRCLNNASTSQSNITIASILADLKLPLLTKAIGRNRVYRYQQTFVQNKIEHPVDFVFSSIVIDNQPFILLQGVDNKAALEMQNMLNSYELIFQAQTEKIKEKNAKLKTADNAKALFLSRMSHELRTPLNAILGIGQIQETLLSDNPQSKKNNQYMLNAGYSLLELIDDMINFVELEGSEATIDIDTCSLNDNLHSAIEHFAPQLLQNNVNVNCMTVSHIVKADQKRLQQIIRSLLSNAIKFNVENGQININIEQITQYHVRVSFEDTGVGISQADQEHLFEPFFRSDYADKQSISGIGVGLALSQKIASMMGAKLSFVSNNLLDSNNDQGMTFYLDLILDID
jgi:signal transduction histidine kinase